MVDSSPEFSRDLGKKELKEWIKAARKVIIEIGKLAQDPEELNNDFFREILVGEISEKNNNPTEQGQPKSTFDQLLKALQESGIPINPNWRQTGEVFLTPKPEPDLIQPNENLAYKTKPNASAIRPTERKPNVINQPNEENEINIMKNFETKYPSSTELLSPPSARRSNSK
ncbi:MAG: hypothetical protein Fur009_4320 [Candidatus Microgenomates bacterium]